VYFEEWDGPLISGVCWVSELIEIAGGDDVFAELRTQQAAKNRTAALMPTLMGEGCPGPYNVE
jgi:hypothetical protein